MSAVRKSSRLAVTGTTPSSTITLTPKISITRSGGVKRRLKLDNEDTPTRSKAAKILTDGVIQSSSTPQSPYETPKKKKQAYYSPVKFDDSVTKFSLGSTTPPRSLFPSTPPKSVGRSTPIRTPSKSMMNTSFETPKSVRRKLFDEGDDSAKCDLFVSTFSSAKASTKSGFGTLQRIAEDGKYARLSTKVKESTNYPLPKKFQRLFDIFERMDRIIAINKGMGKRSVFDELSKNVQKNIKKDFTKDMFAQILAVYPTSYNVKLEEHRTFGQKTPGKKYDLVLEPNLKKDLESYWRPPSPQKLQCPEVQYGSPIKLTNVTKSPKKNVDFIPLSPRKSPTKATPQLRQLQLNNFDRLEPWRIACRKSIFKYKLLLPVFELHDEFLNKIGAAKDDLDIGVFHEKFNLESVPDIIPSELPQPSKDSSIQVKIDPYLEKKEEFVLPENAKATLSQFKSPEKPTHTPNGKVPLSPTKFASGDTPKLSLYERIMLKQKAREEKEEPFKVAKEKRRNQLEFIQKDLLFSIWSFFSRIKPTTTIKINVLLPRLGKDHSTLTGEDLMEHIELLCECASNYFSITIAGLHSTKYFRILTQDQNDYRNVMKLVEDELRKSQ